MKMIDYDFVKKNNQTIRGRMYRPDGDGAYPLVVYSHGFGSCYADVEHHGAAFAENGLACFFIDFCGGGLRSTSDGDMKDMTVFTEAEDLELVIKELSKQDYIDEKQIFLVGESQGGFVSALVAARIPQKIKAICLWYPAFVIPDDARKYFPDGNVKERMQFGLLVGEAYSKSVIDMDPYEAIKNYDGKVLIIHGDKDELVPLSYSEKAVEVYKDASLYIMQGAGHGYEGEDSVRANELTMEFLTSEEQK